MSDATVSGKYLLQALNAQLHGDDHDRPAGIEYSDSDADGWTVDGKPIDPAAEYRVWNCANPHAKFSDDAHMSDWSVGPA